MPIAADSRYVTATIQTQVGPDGETRQEMRTAFPRSKFITYTFYRVIDGERIDTIANDFYGDGRLWWRIADANPEIMDWMDLDPGMVLRVPNA
jgi:phage tail protein X